MRASAWLWAVCLGCGGAPTALESTQPSQVLLETARIRSFRGETLAWSATADQLRFIRGSAEVAASGTRVEIPPRSSPGTSVASGGIELRARTVAGNLNTRLADGEDGVEAQTRTGVIGRTSSARFDGRAMEANGTQPVTIHGASFNLTSNGFHFDLRQDEYDFDGGVSARMGAGG